MRPKEGRQAYRPDDVHTSGGFTTDNPFVRVFIDLHSGVALRSGSYVFHMCEFESVPSDTRA